MILLDSIVIKLKKSAKGDDWFEFDGPAELLEDETVAEWMVNDAFAEHHERIEDAKVVGFHDRDEMVADDARFDGDENFAVIYSKRDDEYRLFFDINAPEAAILRHVLA
jgi:hypothetical protein